jgi:hypothetical protein
LANRGDLLHSFYELTNLSYPLLSLHAASAGAQAFIDEGDATGELLGCWRTAIGQLGRVLLLRGFETAGDLATERRRALLSVNPFNAGGLVAALSMDSYAPFPFLGLCSGTPTPIGCWPALPCAGCLVESVAVCISRILLLSSQNGIVGCGRV